jgi:hypothetical protein
MLQGPADQCGSGVRAMCIGDSHDSREGLALPEERISHLVESACNPGSGGFLETKFQKFHIGHALAWTRSLPSCFRSCSHCGGTSSSGV